MPSSKRKEKKSKSITASDVLRQCQYCSAKMKMKIEAILFELKIFHNNNTFIIVIGAYKFNFSATVPIFALNSLRAD
jgi:hypothetical protein